MRDILRKRVLGTDACNAYVGCFAGFAERIVARVEIFAFLEGKFSFVMVCLLLGAFHLLFFFWTGIERIMVAYFELIL